MHHNNIPTRHENLLYSTKKDTFKDLSIIKKRHIKSYKKTLYNYKKH